jgi:phosphonate transport system substrate-binding protein
MTRGSPCLLGPMLSEARRLARAKAAMKAIWLIMSGALVALIIGLMFWLGAMPPAGQPAVVTPPAPEGQTLRIGLVPERDIFDLRKRHKALTGYLSARLNRPVEVVTVSTYKNAVQHFAQRKIEAAFLGSLVTVLAVDRQDAVVLVKPVREDGRSTYRGVIFVKEESPLHRVEDLGGRPIVMIPTTLAGNLFPMSRLLQAGVFDARPPTILWAGTHDDAITEVFDGRAEAGAAMSLRLDAYEAAHPGARFRRLAESAEVPHDAVVVRGDLAQTVGQELKAALLDMDKDPQGAEALAVFGATRYAPCSIDEYGPVYDMIELLGKRWDMLGIEGPPPKRPPPTSPKP